MLYTVRHYIDYGDKIKSRPKKEFDTAKEAVEYANAIDIDDEDIVTDRIVIFEGCGDELDEEIYIRYADGDIDDRRPKFIRVAKLEEMENLTSKEVVAYINETIMGKFEAYDANLFASDYDVPFNAENKEIIRDTFNPRGTHTKIESGCPDDVRDALIRSRTVAIKGHGIEDSFWTYFCADRVNHNWTATHWSMEKVED